MGNIILCFLFLIKKADREVKRRLNVSEVVLMHAGMRGVCVFFHK